MQQADAYTVSSITTYIRALFDSDLRMQDVWVQGEISNFTQARSGHWYFTLKDENSSLRGVMWRGSTARQSYVPQHGDEVLAHGYVSIYEAGGQYQLYADALQAAGRGDLHQRFEALKARLEAEGLFDPDHKQPLPAFPRRIGVVTSPTAAAFQDVLNVLGRRFPLAEVLLSPTLVQGDQAPPQIVSALEAVQNAGVDVILLVRGGGSLEDLWAFNDERVARAVYDCPLPVVSGVGHEIDFTIVDFVADLRAPTPSAAAEMITPNIDDLALTLRGARERLLSAVQFQLDEGRRLVEAEARILAGLSPLRRLDRDRQRLDELAARTARALSQQIALQRAALNRHHDALVAANPGTILGRGYALVQKPDGRRLTRAGDTAPGESIDVFLAQGSLSATVNDTREDTP